MTTKPEDENENTDQVAAALAVGKLVGKAPIKMALAEQVARSCSRAQPTFPTRNFVRIARLSRGVSFAVGLVANAGENDADLLARAITMVNALQDTFGEMGGYNQRGKFNEREDNDIAEAFRARAREIGRHKAAGEEKRSYAKEQGELRRGARIREAYKGKGRL